jgi:hypothetical protein
MQRFVNSRHDRVDFQQHVAIPQAKHAISLRHQVRGSLGICCQMPRRAVLTTIDFDDDLLAVASEVREIRTDRCLTPKVRITEQASQVPPQLPLCVGRGSAQ